MQTITIEVKDEKQFIKLSNTTLDKIWDNEEDSIYDRYLD